MTHADWITEHAHVSQLRAREAARLDACGEIWSARYEWLDRRIDFIEHKLAQMEDATC